MRPIGTLNCGHAAFPILVGVSEPQYTPEELERFRADNETGVTVDGKHYTGYEAAQMQRKLERSIRAQKRRVLAAEASGDKEALTTAQIRLQRLRQEYGRFSKAAGLQTENERLHVAGVGSRKTALGDTKGLAYGYKREYTTTVDREQFEGYRRVLREKAPATLEEFQKIKRENPEAWDILKIQYRIVNQYKVDSGEFTVDEILALDNQLIAEKRERFTSKFKYSGNIAGAYVDQKYYLAHSKIDSPEQFKAYKGDSVIVGLREKRFFTYCDVQKTDGSMRTGTFHDTEAKLFEEFAAIYNDKPFKSITMISERGMCDSCKGVMKQFVDRFPDVSVRVISNKKVDSNVWKYRRRKK